MYVMEKSVTSPQTPQTFPKQEKQTPNENQ